MHAQCSDRDGKFPTHLSGVLNHANTPKFNGDDPVDQTRPLVASISSRTVSPRILGSLIIKHRKRRTSEIFNHSGAWLLSVGRRSLIHATNPPLGREVSPQLKALCGAMVRSSEKVECKKVDGAISGAGSSDWQMVSQGRWAWPSAVPV
ncbi:hypothetical protein CRV24_004568 [Beauveria bassiana]|nr:hypothetical protein CRV24_004568 [Beauveria bassiana]KAH8711205.1 hypothetical protein HC256_008020 [Beauveria bassiana]